MDSRAFVSLLVLASMAYSRMQVRYTNQEITAKLYELRGESNVGAGPASELEAHGTRVKVEFSASQPSEGRFEQEVTYHLRNGDGTWKKVVVEYECREINMRKMCYSKTCPIANYKAAPVPRNMESCMKVAQEAIDVLKYLILNNPEFLAQKASLRNCMEAKTIHEKSMDKICFNKAIVDLDRAERELHLDGYSLHKDSTGGQHWKRVNQSHK